MVAETPSGPPLLGSDLLALAEAAGQLGVFEGDLTNGTVRLSQRYLELFGLSTFDGKIESWLDCVHREDRVRLLDQLRRAYKAGVTKVDSEFRIVRPSDGELRWIETRRLIFYGNNGRASRMVGVSLDITERKRATVRLRAFTETLEEAVRVRTLELEAQHEARLRAEEQLRQAQKMEAVGQLTGGIAHDFNNMLAVVMGSLDLATRRLQRGDSNVQGYLDNAREGATRAASLTQRLLAFSRQSPLAPVVTDLNALVGAMSELLRRTLGEHIELEAVLAGGIWRANVDRNQLESAIVNLAVNARDAMPDGGKLTIEIANVYLDARYVEREIGVVEGQYVMISVTDVGSGIAPEIVGRVFDPFFTTKAVGKGSGLGLSMVYGFAKQSGGHVRIYSEVGRGTSVKLYLPRHFGSVEEAAAAAPVSSPPTRQAEIVLVVEDDEQVRQVNVEVLRELGYTVHAAGGGEEALRLFDTLGHVDILFTDVVMPGMTGRQLADALHQKVPELKVLYTTGYTRNAVVHNGTLDPGVAFLPKPFSAADLASKLRAVLDS